MQQNVWVKPPMLGRTATAIEERGFYAGMQVAAELNDSDDAVEIIQSNNPYSPGTVESAQWERGLEAGLRVGQKAMPVRAIALPN